MRGPFGSIARCYNWAGRIQVGWLDSSKGVTEGSKSRYPGQMIAVIVIWQLWRWKEERGEEGRAICSLETTDHAWDGLYRWICTYIGRVHCTPFIWRPLPPLIWCNLILSLRHVLVPDRLLWFTLSVKNCEVAFYFLRVCNAIIPLSGFNLVQFN
jgi:hypothetical protein